MKSILRFGFLALFALSASSIARANWYNHPICTNAGVILSWHSTYTDFNGTDFTSPNAPGGGVPAANIRGITENAPVLSGHKRGGSFPVYKTSNHANGIRGWINVLVQYGTNNTTVLSYTYNYTDGAGSFQYPTNSW